MACEIVNFERVVFVMWGKPEFADLARIHHELSRVESVHGQVVFVARVPEDAPAPDAVVRKELSGRTGELIDRTLSYHVIMEGSGFANTVKRSVLSAIYMAKPSRKRLHVHSAYTDVLRAVPVQLRGEVARAFRAFFDRGLLSDRLADRPWLAKGGSPTDASGSDPDELPTGPSRGPGRRPDA